MTSDEQALRQENDRYRREISNAMADLDRLKAQQRYDRLRVTAFLIAGLVGMVLAAGLIAFSIRASAQAADLETRKSLACIDAGGVWDRSANGGQCVWSRP
jgi:hypothetical protein